jgi:proteic killer suppression protein
MSIGSFGDTETEDFFYDGTLPSKGCGWKSVNKVAARKLDMLDAADQPRDLRKPPNNRFKPLKGDLEGFYSIRINDQWRIIFRWEGDQPEDVQITDYH